MRPETDLPTGVYIGPSEYNKGLSGQTLLGVVPNLGETGGPREGEGLVEGEHLVGGKGEEEYNKELWEGD